MRIWRDRRTMAPSGSAPRLWRHVVLDADPSEPCNERVVVTVDCAYHQALMPVTRAGLLEAPFSCGLRLGAPPDGDPPSLVQWYRPRP